MNAWARPRRSYFTLIMLLIGHLILAALVFTVFYTLQWAVGVYVGYLESIHSSTPMAYRVGSIFEIVLLFLDIALTGIVLVLGVWRFIRDA